MANARARRWFYLAILPLAALLRLNHLGAKQLWVDELLQILVTSPLNLRNILLNRVQAVAPLDSIVQHFFMATLGRSEFSARLHAAIFGTLAIVVLFYLAGMLFDQRLGLLAALLYAVYPLHHHYSQEGRPYALFVLITLCSYAVFWRLLLRAHVTDWLCCSFITLVLLFTSYFALWVVCAQFLFVCLLFSPAVRRPLFPPIFDRGFVAKYLAATAIPAALFVPWAMVGLNILSPAPEQFDWKLFARIVKELSDGSYILSLSLLALAIAGARELKRNGKEAQLLLLLLWFLFPIPAILLALWFKNNFFAERYILFTTPALFMLVAQGILSISDAFRPHKVRVAALLTSFLVVTSAVTIFLHLPDRNDDLKGTGQFLQRNVAPGDIVIAPRIEYELSYYFPDIHKYAQGVEVLQRLHEILVSGSKIYVVEWRHLPQPDKELLSEFEARGGDFQEEQITFRGVRIIEIHNVRQVPRKVRFLDSRPFFQP